MASAAVTKACRRRKAKSVEGRWRAFLYVRAEEERSEAAEQSVAPRQFGRPPSAAQDDQLLLEHEILGDR